MSEQQLERLARRITWLDRFRRQLAILLAAVVSPLVLWWVTGSLPVSWPGTHVVIMASVVAVVSAIGVDRFRQPFSIVVAGAAIPFALWRGTSLLPNWPEHIAAFGAALAIFAWYGIETLFGFVLAIWETDYAKHTRPPGLPRAEVVVRRRK